MRALASIFLATALIVVCAAQSEKKVAAKPATSTIDAWISDEKCGAKIDPDCAERCRQEGVKMIVVNNSDKSILPVSNQDSIKAFAGQHVTVKGTIKDGTLTVSSVEPIKK